MASHGAPSLKPLYSNTRIMFSLLPGLGALIIFRLAIHLYRPDIEDAENRVRDHPFEHLYDCYDFIIVGAGSAGAVLADRLTENPEWNVLLLEAGQDENVLSDIPVMFPVLQTSSIDWQFVTEPSDKYCLGMIDNRCKWPRGKVLGGSSALNAMLYIRGNRRDYDNWAAMGNPGWSYKEVLPYFLKSEDMKIPEYQSDPYHSTGGRLTVEHFKYEQPITTNILEAGEQLGYNILDVNGQYQTGFTRSHATVRDGLRCSTAKAFLRPAAKRPNLHVSVHSLVEKILIDEHKRAYGVKFVKHGTQKIVKAKREVILSSGAIQSPQLLMLSGIGDAEHLKELGIFPISDLPGVGQNLQDHVAMGGNSFLFDNPFTNGSDYCFNLMNVFTINSLIDFSIHKTGPLYSMMEAEAMAFVNTKYRDPREDYPDIQLHIAPTADNMDGGIFGKRANGLTDEIYAELYEDVLFQSSFSIVPLLLQPKSRGYLKLRDPNPYSPPRIYPNYYSHPDDVKVMVVGPCAKSARIATTILLANPAVKQQCLHCCVSAWRVKQPVKLLAHEIEGARIVADLAEQPALRKLNTRPNPNRIPGCAKHRLMSDEHLECLARHHTLTIYHPVGTCAMGPPENPAAVVDSRLRVYGVKNLRVVDGSIMPKITSGNTNAPVIMIAEKASDMIKEDWYNMKDELPGCTSGPYSRQHESKPDDEPIKLNLNNHRPDLFNETSSLFPNLPVDPPRQHTKDTKEKTKPPMMSREYEAKYKEYFPVPNVQERSQSDIKDRLSSDLTPLYQIVYPAKYFMDRNTPTLQSYPYWPRDSQRHRRPNQRFLPDANPFKKYKPTEYLSRPSLSRHFKNALPYKSPFAFKYPLTRQREEPVVYDMNEVNSLGGQKDCKIWLYYDGVKYEVTL